MERIIASFWTEGTAYVSSLWPTKTSDKQDPMKLLDSDDKDDRRISRSSTTGSEASCSSSVSSSSSKSKGRFARMMNWMVYGSRKISSRNVRQSFDDIEGKVPIRDNIVAMKNKQIRLDADMIDPMTVRAISVVGRGGYGKVMLVRSTIDGKVYAVKEVAKASFVDKPETKKPNTSSKIEHAEMENMVLQGVSNHPFVTTFHGAFQNRLKVFLFMEFCGGGELFQHMHREGIFSENRTRLYVSEIVSALEYLHSCGILYRDLKPENILLDREGHIRLADFGLSIHFDKQGDDNNMRCFSICGTPEYIAPEIILMAARKSKNSKRTYGKTVDWWALGILTYEMLYRIPPFYDRDRKKMLNKILECDLKFPHSNKYHVSEAAKDFIASFLKLDEKARLGYGNDGSANVKSHEFFDELSFDKVNAMEYIPEFQPCLKDDFDISSFDETFTKETVRLDIAPECDINIDLFGYNYFPEEFSETIWYDFES